MTRNHGPRLSGKVALITGAARGQGRCHALAFAEEGADLIPVDAVRPIDTVGYAMPTAADLKDTVRLVEDRDRRAVALDVDVRDENLLDAVTDAVATLGRLDVAVANAGILGPAKPSWELTRAEWTPWSVNLTGVWQTMKAAIPHIVAGGACGSIIAISSIAGLRGVPHVANYAARQTRRGRACELGRQRVSPHTASGSTPCTPPTCTPR